MQTFHNFEHDRWQQAADGYDRYWQPLVRQTVTPLLDAAGVDSGTGLLDVACGPGYVAGAAAQRGASVTAIDFSSVMIEKARALFSQVHFETGDAQALPCAGGAFDAVTVNFGMLHFEKPEAALAEAFRVLRAGGKIAYTVWAGPPQCQGFAVVYSAIEKYGSLDVALPPGPPFFRFSEQAESSRALGDAGFAEIQWEQLALKWEFNSAEDFLAAFYSGTARTGPLLLSQDPAKLADIHDAIFQSLTDHAGDKGLQIPMTALLYQARKP